MTTYAIREFDPTSPSDARVWTALRHGKDTLGIDRDVVQCLLEVADVTRLGREHDLFRRRAIETLVGSWGINQILDLGSGGPGFSTPEIGCEVHDGPLHVVMVDYDAMTSRHATYLLDLPSPGTLTCLCADIRDTEMVLQHAAQTLDMTRPVGVLAMALLDYLTDDEAARVIAEYVRAVPSGSYLIASYASPDLAEVAEVWSHFVTPPMRTRKGATIGRWAKAAGLTVLNVGEPVSAWYPTPGPHFSLHVGQHALVATKPPASG